MRIHFKHEKNLHAMHSMYWHHYCTIIGVKDEKIWFVKHYGPSDEQKQKLHLPWPSDMSINMYTLISIGVQGVTGTHYLYIDNLKIGPLFR